MEGSQPEPIQSGSARICLAALALFILYGSSGPWAGDAALTEALPGISLPDIAQNVLLYIPLGAFGVWALRGLRQTRAALSCQRLVIALVYSAIMELLQMLLADRIASPLDVVANVVGTGAGIVLARRAEQVWAIAAAQVRRTGLLDTSAKYGLAAVLGTIVIAAWYPFDITLDISTLGERTRAVRGDPWLWPAAAALWAQGARYFVLAAITVFCLPTLAKWAAPVALVVTCTGRVDR